MKIKRIESEQFAGLLDKEVEFTDGLNLIVGDNETGKSTLVDLLFSVLFQDAKLNKRSDADFISKYFPKNIGDVQGDEIDGTVVFETESGKYKLSKEWGLGVYSCKLKLPDGTVVRGQETINEILADELVHRKGVYDQIVFASQKREQMAIQSIMTALSKKAEDLSEVREDMTSTLSQAVLETGGVSLDKIESTINQRMNDLSVNWDFDNDLPRDGVKRGIHNQWKTKGGILRAYYEMEQVRADQAAEEKIEREAEALSSELKEQESSLAEKDQELKEYLKYKGILEQETLLANSVEEKTASIEEMGRILEDWPEQEKSLELATVLKEKKKQAEIHDLYLEASKCKKAHDAAAEALKAIKAIDAEDVKTAEKSLKEKQAAESKINGMNLAASIKQLGSTPIEIRKVSSGEALDLSGEIDITEAVMNNHVLECFITGQKQGRKIYILKKFWK